jgi:lipopolysaccharide heptosyltransferase II
LSILERCHIVLVGDRNDALDCQNVKSLMRSEALDLSGQTNLRELAALLKNASLVITNDSFPLHLADALGAPVLALFGPTDPRKYGPRLVSASRVARRVLFCSPCEKAQCRYGHECMNELGVDETYHDAVRILREDAHPKKLRILVSRLDRLGDVALSLPATAAIRERYPEAFIAMMVRPSIRELVEPCPWIDEVIGYDYGRGGRHQGFIGAIRFIREIRKRRFDAAFILHPSNRAHIVPFLSDIPYRVGLDSNLAFLLTKRVPDRRREGSKHESEYCLDVIRSFGIDGKSGHDLRIPLVPEAQRSVAATLQEQGLRDSDKLVAIHPGASCPSKRWPRERFAELARRILSETSYRIVVVGGTEEKHLGRYLWDQAGGEVIDLSGRLSVKQLAALLARCQVLVSNDSGPVHVAAAVGTPTLALFGRNEPGLARRRWKAMGGGHQTIHKDVGCVVCLAHACTIDFECLKAIDVEEVFNDLTKMLERGGLKQNEKILLPN